MKLFIKNALVLVLVLGTPRSAHPQGTFANLGFESPILPLVADEAFTVPIASGLPGWTGYIGGNQVDRILYNTLSIGASAITLQGPGSSQPIFHGNYIVIMGPGTQGLTTAIAQTGTVPDGAQSLRFYASGSFQVFFDNQPIPLVVLETRPNYTIRGGDISSFANQAGELRFQGGGYLDNIFFSTEPIPEPSTLGLVALGALLFRSMLRRKPEP